VYGQAGLGDSGSKVRDRFQLDSCLIRVDPQLAVAFEHIRHPQNLISQLGLDVDFSEDGLVIAGTQLSLLRTVVHNYAASQKKFLACNWLCRCQMLTDLQNSFTAVKSVICYKSLLILSTTP